MTPAPYQGSSGVERHPFWVDTPAGAMTCWLHVPNIRRIRASPVVLCPPFGYEYTHSHRSLLHLADDLAAAGFAAMRLDYVGTGDSQGDFSTSGLVEAWIGSIQAACQTMSALAGGGTPSLIGLRIGALLAGIAASRTAVRHFVAWHPVVSGRRWVREQEAIQGLALDAPSTQATGIEAGGFVLTHEAARDLRTLDMTEARLLLAGEALVVERDDLKPDSSLPESLAEQGVAVQTRVVGGYLGMMAEPQYTVVPQRGLDAIVEWLDERESSDLVALDVSAFEQHRLRRTARWNQDGSHLVEDFVTVALDGRSGLHGVLCAPEGVPADSSSVVVLANSGSVHHVGPNRLYVELARGLACAGVACLRLDLRNLGDSRLGPVADENHPYPDTAGEDVRAAVTWLLDDRGYASCLVGGLCSGAHTAFHAGLQWDLPIQGVICLNPLTFQWRQGMSLDTPDSHRTTRDAQYYKGAVRSWAKWKKLLTGRANVGYIVRFSVRRATDVARRSVSDVAERLRIRSPGLTGRRLEEYRTHGRALRFVFSTRDPGYAILTAEARLVVSRLLRRGAVGISFVDGADHTFSRAVWRRDAAAAVLAAVSDMSGRAHRAPARPSISTS